MYQVTDYPELITGGSHLILNELAEEKDRITICKVNCDRDHEMSGTTFVLPWARENTEMREALQVQPVSDENINLLQDALMRHASDALLFLERVHTIEIITPTTNRTVVRSSDANRIHLSDGAGTEDWLILRGDFDSEARALRAESSGLIEEDRSSRVKVALCIGEQVKGRLYAGLPTQTQSEWGGHIEATFYPRTDRTGVLFDEDYKSKWNRAALKGAASAVAQRLEEICEALGRRADLANPRRRGEGSRKGRQRHYGSLVRILLVRDASRCCGQQGDAHDRRKAGHPSRITASP